MGSTAENPARKPRGEARCIEFKLFVLVNTAYGVMQALRIHLQGLTRQRRFSAGSAMVLGTTLTDAQRLHD